MRQLTLAEAARCTPPLELTDTEATVLDPVRLRAWRLGRVRAQMRARAAAGAGGERGRPRAGARGTGPGRGLIDARGPGQRYTSPARPARARLAGPVLRKVRSGASSDKQ